MVHQNPKCSKDSILMRLRRIEGQIRGVRRMIETEADCSDILIQTAAVKSAVNQTGVLVFEHHVRECMTVVGQNKQEITANLVNMVMSFVKGSNLPADNNKDNILVLLQNIEYQVKEVQQLIQGEDECSNVLLCIAAIKSAVSRVAIQIFEHHTGECLAAALMEDGNTEEVTKIVGMIGKLI